ncbi:hypothetical protein DTO166G4_3016 [Paecilomyces variotii]|nr:hypothetical protein DTO166G4_3016 [Paecilomyces variotii]KAJ9233343.1 hypothetical protein DTO166G5_5701 [Paecilomyces variotii]KAJ9260769.1 hypothetical protein DTO195F2_4382 [Paecilomyces variotii]KAJ9348895.1 hypothetical protein DTO027B9_7921 [Paecilomyces variotii]KAJ9366325.1 hypothetical protein DTO282E5_9001 [Paecilomyces variotii]
MILSPVSALAVLGLFIVCLYRYIIYPVFLSPLARIPNAHPTAPISSAWILWRRFKGQNNRTIQALHEKLGPIVRLAPSEISINTVDGGIRTVYAGGFEKHEWYPNVFGSYGTVSMFTMTGSKAHSARKRMLSNIYSKSYLQSSPQLKVISHTVIYDRLLPIIQEAVYSKLPIDFHELNQALTMDFVSAYLFGLRNGTNFLQDVPRRKYMLHIYQCRKPFEFYHQEVPNLVTWTRRLGIPLIPKWCDEANEVMDAWGLDMCNKADEYLEAADPESEPTVYKQLKHSMEKQLPSKEADNVAYRVASEKQRLDIACEMFDHLTAGHETSAVGLTYLFWEMSKRPDLQKELREELLTLSPTITYPTQSSTTPELPSPKSIEALPLLNAIVTETLRLHAPIPGIQPRVTPYPACTLVGYDNIPPNTRVNAQAYSLHRNPDVFPDPETWQPKRWLKPADSPELEEMRRWFWAFGSGGRMCVGSNLALQEMKLTVAAIYTNYTTSIVDDEDIEAIDAYTVKPKGEKLILSVEHI